MIILFRRQLDFLLVSLLPNLNYFAFYGRLINSVPNLQNFLVECNKVSYRKNILWRHKHNNNTVLSKN